MRPRCRLPPEKRRPKRFYFCFVFSNEYGKTIIRITHSSLFFLLLFLLLPPPPPPLATKTQEILQIPDEEQCSSWCCDKLDVLYRAKPFRYVVTGRRGGGGGRGAISCTFNLVFQYSLLNGIFPLNHESQLHLNPPLIFLVEKQTNKILFFSGRRTTVCTINSSRIIIYDLCYMYRMCQRGGGEMKIYIYIYITKTFFPP